MRHEGHCGRGLPPSLQSLRHWAPEAGSDPTACQTEAPPGPEWGCVGHAGGPPGGWRAGACSQRPGCSTSLGGPPLTQGRPAGTRSGPLGLQLHTARPGDL